ncbi:MAG: leucyl aminopeptidase [Desulfobulbus propionicus]|nr:MAG: leucyl aminopeptidase [Desulfobulbus propionicus]
MAKDKSMIKLTSKGPKDFRGDLQVFFLESEEAKISVDADESINRALDRVRKRGDFSGEKNETFLFYPGLADEKDTELPKAVLFVGLGKPDQDPDIRREQLRQAGGLAAKKGAEMKAVQLLAVLPNRYMLAPNEIAECLTEGLLLGNYRFTVYKTSEEAPERQNIVGRFTLNDGGLSATAVRKGMNRGKVLAEAVYACRDMANHPGNNWTPVECTEFAKKIARKHGLKCKILEKAAMVKLGMGGILGVNQGSAQPPKLVILEYRTKKEHPTIMLVGKGLTFDSGGISIKPAAGMEDMKYDMCGGAAVLTTMMAIAQDTPSGVNVVGLVPATENLSGSAALKPGDVIVHYGGKTSEIINTDAEGRLILADALAYGIEMFSPEAVVDLATLTGAVIVGLGHHRTGLLANNDELAQRLLDAGRKVGEPLWRLPLGPEYRKQMDSKIADIKNADNKGAGTITAACYLQEFVGDIPWAHLDIAGTAWNYTDKSYVPKGPSGIGTRTLVELVHEWKPLAKVEQDKQGPT